MPCLRATKAVTKNVQRPTTVLFPIKTVLLPKIKTKTKVAVPATNNSGAQKPVSLSFAMFVSPLSVLNDAIMRTYTESRAGLLTYTGEQVAAKENGVLFANLFKCVCKHV